MLFGSETMAKSICVMFKCYLPSLIGDVPFYFILKAVIGCSVFVPMFLEHPSHVEYEQVGCISSCKETDLAVFYVTLTVSKNQWVLAFL